MNTSISPLAALTFDDDGWGRIVMDAAWDEQAAARVKAAADRALAVMQSESDYQPADVGNAGDPRHMAYFRLAARIYRDLEPVNIREAQKYAAYLPPGVFLSEATTEELRAAIAAGRLDGSAH
jgi:hypothetical protein